MYWFFLQEAEAVCVPDAGVYVLVCVLIHVHVCVCASHLEQQWTEIQTAKVTGKTGQNKNINEETEDPNKARTNIFFMYT
jgi:hypothetical protein